MKEASSDTIRSQSSRVANSQASCPLSSPSTPTPSQELPGSWLIHLGSCLYYLVRLNSSFPLCKVWNDKNCFFGHGTRTG